MLSRQRRAVAELAAAAEAARGRAAEAAARTERAKSRFLTNPLNLLLPFTGGVLGGALALHRRPVSERRGEGHGEKHHRPVAWASLATTATTLWNASLPLRLSLAESRAAARLHDEAAAPRTSPEASEPSGAEPPDAPGSSGAPAPPDPPGPLDPAGPVDGRASGTGQRAPPA